MNPTPSPTADGAAAPVPAAPAPVLVVDDDAELRQSLRWTLEDEGLVVETAADGGEAVAHASRRPPALVVLDYGLPDGSGEAVAARLRARCGEALPILVVTADGNAPAKAARAGAFAYLHKPFDLEQLVALVRDQVG
jgi:DNA-binding response OmpR family regulator